MRVSGWVPIASMWLVLVLTLAVSGESLAAWLALLCFGLSVLSAFVDHLGRREVALVREISRIQAARIRNHEKGTDVHIR